MDRTRHIAARAELDLSWFPMLRLGAAAEAAVPSSSRVWSLRSATLLCCALLGALLAAIVPFAAIASASETAADSGASVPPLPAAGAIESLSDTELTALSVHWSQLSAEQRRALLKTVRSRMQRQDRAARQSSPLTPQRRYGRVVRKPDGGLVSIETRVFQNAEGTRGTISRRMTFGAGFEQRQRTAQEAGAVGTADPAPRQATAEESLGPSTSGTRVSTANRSDEPAGVAVPQPGTATVSRQ